MKTLLPSGWKAPIGYANGIVAPAGARIVFIAGQVGWTAQQQFDPKTCCRSWSKPCAMCWRCWPKPAGDPSTSAA